MPVTEVILVVAKATILFLAGLACLYAAKRASPATRHLISLSAIGGSIAVAATIFLPEPAVIIHMPMLTGTPVAGGAGPKVWPWAQFATAIWTSGFALVALRYLTGCVLLARLRRSATPLVLGAAETAPGVPLFAAGVSVPIVTGLLRPVILMPRSAADWPERQRTAALRHELAHVQRGDLWANFAGMLACAAYWFHPLVWVVTRRMREEQEAACDDLVLEGGFDCAAYAEALVETARCAGGQLLPSCPMADRASVRARVARVLAQQAARPVRAAIRRTSKRVFAGLLLALAAVSCAVGAERVYKVGGAVTQPVILQRVDPDYTDEARNAGIQGTVLLKAVVGSDGIARDIVVERGIGAGLDQSAMEALRQWRFKPATRKAKPVAVNAKIAFDFKLR